jgi:hypothetical protein
MGSYISESDTDATAQVNPRFESQLPSSRRWPRSEFIRLLFKQNSILQTILVHGSNKNAVIYVAGETYLFFQENGVAVSRWGQMRMK